MVTAYIRYRVGRACPIVDQPAVPAPRNISRAAKCQNTRSVPAPTLPVLIFAHKQDMPSAISPESLASALELPEATIGELRCNGSYGATEGESTAASKNGANKQAISYHIAASWDSHGLHEGLDWVSVQLFGEAT